MSFNKEMFFKCVSCNTTDSWSLTVSGMFLPILMGFACGWKDS